MLHIRWIISSLTPGNMTNGGHHLLMLSCAVIRTYFVWIRSPESFLKRERLDVTSAKMGRGKKKSHISQSGGFPTSLLWDLMRRLASADRSRSGPGWINSLFVYTNRMICGLVSRSVMKHHLFLCGSLLLGCAGARSITSLVFCFRRVLVDS